MEGLTAEVGRLLGDDPGRRGDAPLAQEYLALERLEDQLAAARLHLLATLDARGAAGAEAGVRFPSTQSWLRARLRMSAGAAAQRVRTARALHRGALGQTAQALATGEVSYAHAVALAEVTHDLPPAKVTEAEPVLLAAARRLDPARLRRLAGHLRNVLDPEAADERARAWLERRGLWLSPTFEGLVDVEGLLDPEAGEALRAALEPLARPTGPEDERLGAQRRADALGELARQALQGDRLPDSGGLRPQVTVTADLASLLAGRAGVGGTGAWGGVLDGETIRRLACDEVLTRALVHRHPDQAGNGQATNGDGSANGDGHASPGGGDGQARHCRDDQATTGEGHAHPDGSRASHAGSSHADADPDGSGQSQAAGDGQDGASGEDRLGARHHASPPGGAAIDQAGLAEQVRAAVALLPPPLGAPLGLLDLGRATRVVPPGLRRALALRDGGCAAQGCDRPPGWSDAHHLRHWVHGGPTSLENLVLLCRTHHVAVHEGGWQLARDPASGRVVLVPPARDRGQPRGHAPPAA